MSWKRHGVAAVDETFEVETRHYSGWSLTTDGSDVPCYVMNGCAFAPAGVTAELISVGDRLDPNVDVAGKTVVFDLRCGPVLSGSAAGSVSDYVYNPSGVMAAGTFGGQGGPAPSNFPAPFYRRRTEALSVSSRSSPDGMRTTTGSSRTRLFASIRGSRVCS